LPPHAPDEPKYARRHWKNRLEHQYIVKTGLAARERRAERSQALQNVHLQV
jgi:hypothetical protein